MAKLSEREEAEARENPDFYEPARTIILAAAEVNKNFFTTVFPFFARLDVTCLETGGKFRDLPLFLCDNS